MGDLFTAGNIGILLGVVSSILATFKLLSAVRKRNVATAIYHAYHIVDDLAAADKRENALDKTAMALKAVNEWMRANGWRELKADETEQAKLAWSSMHGQALAKNP